MHVANPDQHVQIDILAGDLCVASAIADQLKPHLVEFGYGDGRFGFRFYFDEAAGLARTGARVIARWPGGEMELGRFVPIDPLLNIRVGLSR